MRECNPDEDMQLGSVSIMDICSKVAGPLAMSCLNYSFTRVGLTLKFSVQSTQWTRQCDAQFSARPSVLLQSCSAGFGMDSSVDHSKGRPIYIFSVRSKRAQYCKHGWGLTAKACKNAGGRTSRKGLHAWNLQGVTGLISSKSTIPWTMEKIRWMKGRVTCNIIPTIHYFFG